MVLDLKAVREKTEGLVSYANYVSYAFTHCFETQTNLPGITLLLYC